MQASPRSPTTRAQKLRWYAGQLMADAANDEKSGDIESAISHYLKAAELLLLLAKVEESYTAWRSYVDAASQCQQRTRRLIALRPSGDVATNRTVSSSDSTPPA